MATTNVYAIRNGNLIEIRTFQTTPRVRISKVTKTFIKESPRYKYVEEAPYYIRKIVKKKVTKVMAQIDFIGGKLIGYGKYSSLSKSIELKVGDAEVVRLTLHKLLTL